MLDITLSNASKDNALFGMRTNALWVKKIEGSNLIGNLPALALQLRTYQHPLHVLLIIGVLAKCFE